MYIDINNKCNQYPTIRFDARLRSIRVERGSFVPSLIPITFGVSTSCIV